MSPSPAKTVVVLADERARRLLESQQDIQNPLGQLHFARLLTRAWPCLPDAEYKLVAVIFGRTILWGEEDKYFTYKFLRYGDKQTSGIGKGETQIREHLQSLERRGVVTIDRTKAHLYGLKITINLEWEPRADVLPGSTRLKAKETYNLDDDGWENPVEPPSEFRGTPPRFSEAPPHGKPRGFIEEPFLEHPFSAEPLPVAASQHPVELSEDFDFSDVWEDQHQASPSKASNPPIALAPPSTAEGLLAGGLRKTHARPAKDCSLLKPVAIEATFRTAFENAFANHPGAVFAPWGRVNQAIVKNAMIGKWAGTPEELHGFVNWSVTNWANIVFYKFDWMKRNKPPEVPCLRFFVSQLPNFRAYWTARQSDDWLASIKDHEQKEFARLTIKEGLTRELAQMRLHENRIREQLRDEVRKGKEEANSRLRQALIAEERARRMGSTTPHPNSPAAREAAAVANRAELARVRAENPPPAYDPDVDMLSMMKPWEELQ